MSGTVRVLVSRELRLLVAQRSRLVGALAQPLLFWVVLGFGWNPTFRMPGSENGPSYLTWFFPGMVIMLLLFASISATMSVIDDRHGGFLQGVLAAPGSRAAVAAGKVLGGTAVATVQAVLVLFLLPAAGYEVSVVSPLVILLSVILTALAFNGIGFVLAWRLDSTQGYHVVMSIVLIPLWVLSGALFPMGAGVMAWIARLNPVTYSVRGLRLGLAGGSVAEAALPLAVMAAFAAVSLLAAALTARRGGI